MVGFHRAAHAPTQDQCMVQVVKLKTAQMVVEIGPNEQCAQIEMPL